MSDVEEKKQVEEPRKKPYNLREKKNKDAAYRSLIRPELADELYDKIMEIVVLQKRYRDAAFSAKALAEELQTNTRYLSAVVNSRLSSFNSVMICACTVTSRAVVGSSAISSRGRHSSAMAIITR